LAAETLLELRDVHAGYGDSTILRGVDLTLSSGSLTAVIGANGAGKSTLLKTIFGLVDIKQGSVHFWGDDITRSSSRDRLRRGITIVPQGRCNFPLMSVRENLEMGAYTRTDDDVGRDIDQIYKLFSVLGEKRNQLAGHMSGGEQQLLEMGMALTLSPELILIDEPSLGLSAGMQKRVFQSILDLRDQGTAILLVEQNAVQALKIADRGIVIEQGRVGWEGSGVEMLDNPRVREAYLGLAVGARRE
jgi:ABC-type branched-subunit amino acid transport system ATPase component